MRIHKLESTDAFIAFDLEDVPSYGVTRLARKVLQDGAKLLARSTTYAFASFELRRGGASAGINADGDERDAAVTAFFEEAGRLIAENRWATDPGLGLTEDDVSPVRSADPRPAALWTEGLQTELAAVGAVAAATGFRELGGARVAIDGDVPGLAAAVTAAGGEVVDGGVTAEADVLFAGGKAGSIDHERAASIQAPVVVPAAPVPVTAKALATLGRNGAIVVPDFISTAAPLLAGYDLGAGDPVERVRGAAASLRDAGTGAWMAAVERAEQFLSSWQDELPFGRPLA